jgi:hypothetical protein
MAIYNQPFAEQLAFFRQKLNLPTEAWDDITLAAHDRAFVVAGAQGADLLADLNSSARILRASWRRTAGPAGPAKAHPAAWPGAPR